jgi:hypothetical protein
MYYTRCERVSATPAKCKSTACVCKAALAWRRIGELKARSRKGRSAKATESVAWRDNAATAWQAGSKRNGDGARPDGAPERLVDTGWIWRV